MICKPRGRPAESSPTGTDTPGRPARFTVTVNTSFRYISTGSAEAISPRAKAAEGVAGVTTLSNGQIVLILDMKELLSDLGQHVDIGSAIRALEFA